MGRLIVWGPLLVAVAACGTEPTVGPVVGRFGGYRDPNHSEVRLVASDTAVRLSLACAEARFPAPLVADAEGHFTATGTLRTSILLEGPIHLQGEVHGPRVRLEVLDSLGNGAVNRYGVTLWAGLEPTVPSHPCPF